MITQITLYNLAEHVSQEEYEDFVAREKGPITKSLPSVMEFKVVKITGSESERIPYQYAGLMKVTSLEEFRQKAIPTQKFQDFIAKFTSMTTDVLILTGEQIY